MTSFCARWRAENLGGKRLGDETSSPLLKQCVMRRRTGTSALSALPVRLVVGKIYLSTNRKSHFLSSFFSQPWTMIKNFFINPGSQLNPRTYKQSYTPHRGTGGGGGLMEPLPWVFAVFQYFGEILPLLESL